MNRELLAIRLALVLLPFSAVLKNAVAQPFTGALSTAVAERPTVRPEGFFLAQNYPNPFNPSTLIQYEIPQTGEVRLAIYDLLGGKVRTLVEARQSAGMQQATWDGRDEHGQRVSSGVYLYRLEAGDFTMTKRLVLMR